jgi:succinoglycan biosynthesis protein ExoA
MQDEPRPPQVADFISVVVPVRNEAACIDRTLGELFRQDYDPERFEVIVVDGASTDGTPERVRRLQRDHPHLRLFHNPRRLSSAARNIGIRQARGDLIVVIDGHCELRNEGFLRELSEAFRWSGADCLGRPQPLDVTAATALQRGIAAARSSRLGHHPASFIYAATERFVRPQSVATAYRRSVFEAVGLFDEDFDACEDVEFNHRVDRAGLRCYFTPRVRVYYHPRSSLKGLFRQMARYGRGRVRLFRKHPETRSLSLVIPPVFVLGLVAGPALAALWPALAAAYAGALALYASAVAAVSLQIARRPGSLRLLPWLPLIFPTIHLGAGCGILEEWLFGRLRARRSIPHVGQLS